ncbi:MAG: hypothetical protein DMC59_02800 [Verrucomicrobia bacterium]|nr:MAG: hypothetical protein DMC59_02800 [Verrucomicrobiota bacterium]
MKLLNPNRALNASYEQSTSMKKLILLCICSTALTIGVFAQAPTASPIASPAAATPTATTAVIASPSDLADRIHQKLEKKFRGKHGIVIGGDHDELDLDGGKSHEDIPAMVIPLVGIVFLTIFGAPVLIVLTIGLIALSVSRSRQRTIRMMVEKGQPVPAELLAPHTRAVRQRSDVRRGVIWTMIGLGAMIFFGAVNDWEGGVWSIGLIPFLIGLGYLMVWKLEGKKNVPPPPPGP